MKTVDVNKPSIFVLQKKIMFKKIRSAGYALSGASSINDLGELVSAVPPSEFENFSPADVKNSLEQLKEQANEFSPLQRKAIAKKV